jgi:CheY-like chemotaxis protein
VSVHWPGARPLVIAAVPDLLFATRITETARAAGIELVHVPLAELAARVAERRPDRVIVDLTAPDAVATIGALRAQPALVDLPIVGFYPHVDDALRRAALAAGATHVLPRSAFSTKLAEVLAGSFPQAP